MQLLGPSGPCLEESLRAALAELGDDPRRIARTLREERVVGRPHNSGGCPLQKHLAGRLGKKSIQVTKVSVSAKGSIFRRRVSVELPPGPRAFVRNVDDGFHPELNIDRRARELVPA